MLIAKKNVRAKRFLVVKKKKCFFWFWKNFRFFIKAPWKPATLEPICMRVDANQVDVIKIISNKIRLNLGFVFFLFCHFHLARISHGFQGGRKAFMRHSSGGWGGGEHFVRIIVFE